MIAGYPFDVKTGYASPSYNKQEHYPMLVDVSYQPISSTSLPAQSVEPDWYPL